MLVQNYNTLLEVHSISLRKWVLQTNWIRGTDEPTEIPYDQAWLRKGGKET